MRLPILLFLGLMPISSICVISGDPGVVQKKQRYISVDNEEEQVGEWEQVGKSTSETNRTTDSDLLSVIKKPGSQLDQAPSMDKQRDITWYEWSKGIMGKMAQGLWTVTKLVGGDVAIDFFYEKYPLSSTMMSIVKTVNDGDVAIWQMFLLGIPFALQSYEVGAVNALSNFIENSKRHDQYLHRKRILKEACKEEGDKKEIKVKKRIWDMLFYFGDPAKNAKWGRWGGRY